MSSPARRVAVVGCGALAEDLAARLAAPAEGSAAATVVERLDGDAAAVAARLAGAGAAPAGEGAAGAEGAEGAFDLVIYVAAGRGRGCLPDPGGLPDPTDAAAVLAAVPGTARAVVVASSEIYSPSPHHPGMIDEARFAPRPDRTAIAARWQAFETAAEAAVPATRRTVLRAAPVPLPGGDDDFSRLLGGRLALSVPGHDPSLQLLDAEDLAAAVERAAAGPPGTYNVVPAASVPLGRALRLAGVRRLPVPLWAQRLARRAAAAAGSPRAAERPESLRYSWTASGELAERELGFTARHGSAAAVARFAAARAGRAVPEEPAVPAYDDFGVDPDYIAAYGRTLFRFLHDAYWRVEWRGLEHVPRQGPVVLTGVHRGFMPFDGVMALHLLARETGRIPRFLLHPTLLKFPFLHDFMTRLGGIPACRENAARVLGSGEIVGIFPEGIRGAFTPYRRAYRLGKFGRDEYVRMALENRAPILPFVTVGSAEIFPILARLRWGWWKRYSMWPAFPITPTFPWLPVPLPSKWHTVFLPPIHVERTWGPEAADDPAVVARISAEVRRQMALALGEMLARRRSIFFGSVFEDAPGRAVPREAR